MSPLKKTIKIDPRFFQINKKSGKSRKKYEKKKKPNINFKPNKVRKDLLVKIKDFQKKEKENKDEIEKEKKKEEEETQEEINEFQNNFNNSLQFLQNLSQKKQKQRENQKKRKHQRKSKKNNHTIKNHNTTISNYPPVDIELPTTFSTETEICTNENIKLEIEEPLPYGCLKNGKKPTYRTWKNQTQKTPITMHQGITIEEPVDKPIFFQREQKLNEIKQHYQDLNPKQPSLLKNKKYLKKETIRKLYKLGRCGKKISVLIKDRRTRKQIAHEQTLLKKKSLLEIKNYLRNHNLLKSGTEAPPDVLRHMYEQAVLSGDIQNKSDKILLHNFLQPE